MIESNKLSNLLLDSINNQISLDSIKIKEVIYLLKKHYHNVSYSLLELFLQEIIPKMLSNKQISISESLIIKSLTKQAEIYFFIKELRHEIINTKLLNSFQMKIVISSLLSFLEEKEFIFILENHYQLLIDSINSLINFLEENRSLLKIDTIRQLVKLKKKLAKKIGYQYYKNSDLIEVKISVLDETFNIMPLSFTSEVNKSINSNTEYIFRNANILSLVINEYSFGVDGTLFLKLDTAFNKNNDFDFLFKKNHPLLIKICLIKEFLLLENNKIESKKNHQDKLEYLLVSKVSSELNIRSKDLTFLEEEYKYKHLNEKILKIKMYDPLKAIWSVHKPFYIDFNISYSDIFKNELFFDHICTLNIESSIDSLSKKYYQLFIFASDSSFYDFFIRTLKSNNLFLKYYFDFEKMQVTYYIFENLDSIIRLPFKNKNKLDSFDKDLFFIKKYEIKKQKQDFLPQNRLINTNINIDKEYEQINPEDTQVISYKDLKKMINSNPIDINDWDQNLNSVKLNLVNEFIVKYYFDGQPPFIDTSISFNKIKVNEIFNFSKKIDNLFSYKRKLKINQSEYISDLIDDKISSLYDEGENINSIFEKHQMINNDIFPSTHHTNMHVYFIDQNSLRPIYPKISKYCPIVLYGKVFIGDNLDKNFTRGYKFFEKYDITKEGAINFIQTNKEKENNDLLQAKEGIYYAIEVTQSLLKKKKKIFVKFDSNINNSSNNQFKPLRNGDIVKLLVKDNEIEVIQAVSNSAISSIKSSDTFIQRELLGPSQICELSYQQKEEIEEFFIKQNNNSHENIVSINNKHGITILYKSQEEE